MKKEKFTKYLQICHKEEYNANKILTEIESEIKEKGFSIFETDEQKRLEFLYSFSNKYFFKKEWFFIILRYHLFLCFPAIFLGLEALISLFVYSFIFFSPFYLLMLLHKYRETRNIKNNNNLKETPGIKDRYILVTKEYILINDAFHKLTKGNLRKSKALYEKIFSPGKYYYKEEKKGTFASIYKKINKRNAQQRKITRLKNSLALLEKYFEYLKKLKERIGQEIDMIKNGSFDFANIYYYIQETQNTIQETIKEKDICLQILQNLQFDKYIDFEKFKTYLKEKLMFSLKGLKFILKSHIFVINNIYNSNKKYNSYHIKLANTRLKIYQEKINKQIKRFEKEMRKLK